MREKKECYLSNRAWIIFGVIVIGLFGGLIYLGQRNTIDVSGIDQMKIQSASEISGNIADHTYGNKQAKVTLVEYGDYQCPGCGSAYQPVKSTTEKYEDQLSFVFRNFPLATIHPNARAAAAAAETAGLMGKYWEMHDVLYENQSEWQSAGASERTTIFEGYAQTIGLNAKSFRELLTSKSDTINQKISFDQALGQKAGVSGTPTFYLNGKLVDQYVKDGKIVDKSTEGSSPIWSDAAAFEELILLPAFKEAGVDVSAVKTENAQ